MKFVLEYDIGFTEKDYAVWDDPVRRIFKGAYLCMKCGLRDTVDRCYRCKCDMHPVYTVDMVECDDLEDALRKMRQCKTGLMRETSEKFP